VVSTATRTLRIILDRDRWTPSDESPSAASILFAEPLPRPPVRTAQAPPSGAASSRKRPYAGSDEMVERSGAERREVFSGGRRAGGEVGDALCEEEEAGAGVERREGGRSGAPREEQFVPSFVARLVELVEEGCEVLLLLYHSRA